MGWFPQGVIASGVGATRAKVHLADLNGDGRAEYLWCVRGECGIESYLISYSLRVHDDGSVDAWLNRGGPDDGPNVSYLPFTGEFIILMRCSRRLKLDGYPKGRSRVG